MAQSHSLVFILSFFCSLARSLAGGNSDNRRPSGGARVRRANKRRAPAAAEAVAALGDLVALRAARPARPASRSGARQRAARAPRLMASLSCIGGLVVVAFVFVLVVFVSALSLSPAFECTRTRSTHNAQHTTRARPRPHFNPSSLRPPTADRDGQPANLLRRANPPLPVGWRPAKKSSSDGGAQRASERAGKRRRASWAEAREYPSIGRPRPCWRANSDARAHTQTPPQGLMDALGGRPRASTVARQCFEHQARFGLGPACVGGKLRVAARSFVRQAGLAARNLSLFSAATVHFVGRLSLGRRKMAPERHLSARDQTGPGPSGA